MEEGETQRKEEGGEEGQTTPQRRGAEGLEGQKKKNVSLLGFSLSLLPYNKFILFLGCKQCIYIPIANVSMMIVNVSGRTSAQFIIIIQAT